MVLSLLTTLLSLTIVFAVRIGVTHGIANLFVYEDKSLKLAGKIYAVELLYNFALSISLAAFFYGFGAVSPVIAGLLVFAGGLIGGLAILWQMIKYTGKIYDTHLFEAAIIYLLSLGLGGLLLGALNLFLPVL